jgi:hypothetical protein
MLSKYLLGAHINTLVRRIFAPKRVEVMRGRRKLHNEELNSLYSSPNIITVSNQGG